MALNPVDISNPFRAGAGEPKHLFALPFVPTLIHRYPYVVSRDNQRFIASGEDRRNIETFNVVLNWPAALKPR